MSTIRAKRSCTRCYVFLKQSEPPLYFLFEVGQGFISGSRSLNEVLEETHAKV